MLLVHGQALLRMRLAAGGLAAAPSPCVARMLTRYAVQQRAGSGYLLSAPAARGPSPSASVITNCSRQARARSTSSGCPSAVHWGHGQCVSPSGRRLLGEGAPLRPIPSTAAAQVCSMSAVAGAEQPGPAAGDPLELLSSEQRRQVDAFVDFLLQENEKMNLTAIKDRGEVYERHVRDSLALLPVLDARMPAAAQSSVGSGAGDGDQGIDLGLSQGPAGPRLLDVGSGAGLPGLLLAIARPHWQVTMLDTLRKRCDFVTAAADAVGLTNVSTLWMRAEDAGKDPQLRESFDVVTARAVAEMRMLAELCLPLTRVGGFWVAAKGAEPGEEILAAMNAIQTLGGVLLSVKPVDSESPKGPRTAAVVAKTSATPAKYPRKPKKLVKEPL